MANTQAHAVVPIAVIVVVVGYWLWDPVETPDPPRIVATSVPSREPVADVSERAEDRADASDADRRFEPRPEPPPEPAPVHDRPAELDVDDSRDDSAGSEATTGAGERAPDEDDATESAAGAGRRYTIRPGDSLSRIAQREYGSVRYVELIFNANRDVLPTEDSLSVGDEIVLPPPPSDPPTEEPR
ncbi:MAG: LysM domain-containing protein [Planctomycetota bacterium]